MSIEANLVLRYLALSTAIVLLVAMTVAGWVNRDLIRIKIASVYARVHPKPQPSNAPGGETNLGLHGDAPWALSALPECLLQLSETTGPLDYVLKHVPPGAQQIGSPASLQYGDCTILLSDDEAYVRRGSDRYRIPPRVRFYRGAGVLVLLRESSNGNELRVYQPSDMRNRP